MVRRCGALRVRALAGDLLRRVDAVAATGAAAEAKQCAHFWPHCFARSRGAHELEPYITLMQCGLLWYIS